MQATIRLQDNMRTLLFTLLISLTGLAQAASCRQVADSLNKQLEQRIDPGELAMVLESLNHSGRLPDRFVTKNQARAAGWRPGSDLHRVLPGKSMGGDRFGNYEKRLPPDRYQEADLDYRGGKRNAKRIVFSRLQRFVTVDHYNTFHRVPPCG